MFGGQDTHASKRARLTEEDVVVEDIVGSSSQVSQETYGESSQTASHTETLPRGSYEAAVTAEEKDEYPILRLEGVRKMVGAERQYDGRTQCRDVRYTLEVESGNNVLVGHAAWFYEIGGTQYQS